MITKFGTRKSATFGQLINYMHKSEIDKHYRVLKNIYKNEEKHIKQRFQENSENINKRKNGIILYHDILSITKTKTLTDEEHKNKLKKITEEYIEKRAKNHLVYAVLHEGINKDNSKNYHYHIMFSANEKDSSKKLWLSNKQYEKFRKEFNNHVQEKYPELKQKDLVNNKELTKEKGEKLSQKGHEYQRRTGKPPPQKERVKQALKNIFETTRTKQAFFESLKKENLKFDNRSKKTVGFIDLETNRKFRISTLGLTDEFKVMNQKIEHEQERYKHQQNQYKQAQGQREQVKPLSRDDKEQKYTKEQEKEQDIKLSKREVRIKQAEEMLNRTCERGKDIDRGFSEQDEKINRTKEELKSFREKRQSRGRGKSKGMDFDM
ncbi:relaxase/mobilization nuclease domain-containing protein [Candidatus Woesearchaeota archaeon]|nr:relaxase/mobilization nuclease domain-containing protein [Candidatus Woesearchaeota archaeon]